MKTRKKPTFRPFIWLDKNLLFILSVFLLVFIPLYPKWPLLDLVPGYIVRLRLEDLLIGAVFLILLIQVLRKKVSLLPNPLILPIGIYLVVGFLSLLSGIFITHTIPMQTIHIGKAVLHYLRRVEYFSLFFIFYASVRTLKQVKTIVYILGITAIAVSLYGFGQKYLSWPVYSTMNREFAKGWRLVLTQYARVPSTFAGHYDLAAFLAFFMTIFAGLFLFLRKSFLKTFLIIVFILSFFVLILTASRTSFIAYLIGISVVIVLLAFRAKKPILWGLTRFITIISLSLLVMFFYGDLSERFANFFKFDMISNYVFGTLIREKLLGYEDGDLQFVQLNNDLSLVYSRSDIPPKVVNKGGQKLPPGVYEDIPDYVGTESAYATRSGAQVEVDGKFVDASRAGEATAGAVVAVPRDYSDTAFVVGLSSAIRFDALWPMAIKGFLKNPLLGSGYSTLNKKRVSDFTEAESTDNDYLRALGETGLLGFIAFFAIIAVMFKTIFTSLPKIKDRFSYALTVGFIGGTVALLVNALYIDVFEASKIAFMFWGMAGILLVVLKLQVKNETKQ